CVRRWEMLADADGAHRDSEAAVERRTATVMEFDGVLHLDARGGAVHAASMVEIFQRFCDAEFATDVAWVRDRFGEEAPHGLMPRSDRQRRFDALLAIFEAAAVAPVDGQAPEPVVNIVVDQVTYETHMARRRLIPTPKDLPDVSIVDRRCETTSGILLDPDDVIAAALAGRVRRVVFDSAGVVIDMGRKSRLFAGAAREAVLMQSSRCIWPGCCLPSGRCQADHSDEWVAHDGATRPGNGAPLCGRHNRWKNRGFRTRRDDNGHWHTYRPDGTEIA
ncbi:MAG TPA: HNH endonuclease signature motif containing protein, partial [Ilumatobacteraceae bacterium]|nr:HNH endonuclease signature motif containing protein [Ilumatobacteraceae bacterium]